MTIAASAEPAATVQERTRATRTELEPIPFTRIVGVELRKMFDTRAGFWLLASIAITAAIATVATVVFAPDSELTYEAFATAVGVPLSVLLPMVAVLGVTGEWSQRNGLTTFTLIPHRGRVIWAKAVCAIGIGVVAFPIAMAIGAVGNVVGTAIAGVDTTWNIEPLSFLLLILAGVLGMLMGFMLGVLFRSSAVAIVAYFVYALVLPGVFATLAAYQEWFAERQNWIDFQSASATLYDQIPSAEQWAQIGVTGTFWLVLPLAVGVWLIRRAEVK